MKLKFKNHEPKFIMYSDNVMEVINEIIEEDTIRRKSKKEKGEKVDSATYLLHLVYIGLYSFRNAETGSCFPSFETIAKKIKTTKMSVSRAVKILEKNGVILIKPTINPYNGKITNNYFFPLEYNLYEENEREKFKKLFASDEENRLQEYFDEFVDIEEDEETKEVKTPF